MGRVVRDGSDIVIVDRTVRMMVPFLDSHFLCCCAEVHCRLRVILCFVAASCSMCGGWTAECVSAMDDAVPRNAGRVTIQSTAASKPFEIQVVDDQTGRGVPLVDLLTVNQVRFVTDNHGRVAITEPDWMHREIFFTLRSHGYEMKKDGFGFPGVRLRIEPSGKSTIKLKRINLAERLCRLTGEGRERDSQLLGYSTQTPSAPPGLVAGQDSIQAVLFEDKIRWFWGDTQRMSYPLGMFRMAGATMPRPQPTDDFSHGMPYDYFVDENGFARAMMPLPDEPQGVVWLDGMCVVPDDSGSEQLICHYSRRPGLAEQLSHGLAQYDRKTDRFERLQELPLNEKWRFPHGHPTVWKTEDQTWIVCGSPALNVRVPARLRDLLNRDQYQAFSCATRTEGETVREIARDSEGHPNWTWQKSQPPVSSIQEAALFKSGQIKATELQFLPASATDPQQRVSLHNGSVFWNAHRQRWILLAGQLMGQKSFLGEVWYAEARTPTGPFRTAVQVLTHDRQTFYNVCHHPILDRDQGRTILFEGTYTSDFSGNPDKTPWYDYNQILYRLDLDTPALRAAYVE